MSDALFFCNRREMPVNKDCTDCIGCGLREYPTPCNQYADAKTALLRGKLGYVPEIFRDVVPAPDVTE